MPHPPGPIPNSTADRALMPETLRTAAGLLLRLKSRFVSNPEVCAEQRIVHEGSSPSGAQMRGAISKSGVNSLAGRRKGKVWRGLNGHEGESRIQPRPT